jgi:hypothetical protein
MAAKLHTHVTPFKSTSLRARTVQRRKVEQNVELIGFLGSNENWLRILFSSLEGLFLGAMTSKNGFTKHYHWHLVVPALMYPFFSCINICLSCIMEDVMQYLPLLLQYTNLLFLTFANSTTVSATIQVSFCVSFFTMRFLRLLCLRITEAAPRLNQRV